jgi:3-oxoacyl-[acyl-carrier-protein] synthase-1
LTTHRTRDSRIYIHRGALVSNLGYTLQQAVAALQQTAPAPDWITTTITGDSSRAEDRIPYRLLFPKSVSRLSCEQLLQRSYAAVEGVVDLALNEAGLDAARRKRTAVFLGSSSFLIGAGEQQYKEDILRQQQGDTVSVMPLKDSRFGLLAEYIARCFHLSGETYTFNTACTASANALLCAAKMLSLGRIDHALVVGTELFNETTMLGFNNLELLTRTGMRPFDRRRNGLELGEACAAVVLSRQPVANGERNFYLCGGANLCDTYSISAANPDGSSVVQVIQQALVESGLLASEILAIKTHGTASLMNDDAESSGLNICFTQMPPLCALKPYLGHTLGACGLAELLLFCEALRNGFLPATHRDFEPDDKLGLQLNTQTAATAQPDFAQRRGNYMLNYFGFGGNNTSLLISDL